jgi:hypothetical protein
MDSPKPGEVLPGYRENAGYVSQGEAIRRAMEYEIKVIWPWRALDIPCHICVTDCRTGVIASVHQATEFSAAERTKDQLNKQYRESED